MWTTIGLLDLVLSKMSDGVDHTTWALAACVSFAVALLSLLRERTR
jgi:hypothetical protein